jgi:hypothetical protein
MSIRSYIDGLQMNKYTETMIVLFSVQPPLQRALQPPLFLFPRKYGRKWMPRSSTNKNLDIVRTHPENPR